MCITLLSNRPSSIIYYLLLVFKISMFMLKFMHEGDNIYCYIPIFN